jgi:hypothetical protein
MTNPWNEAQFETNQKRPDSSHNMGILCTPCPLCERLRKGEAQFYAQLALQCTRLEKTTDELFSHELCNLHAWQFSRISTPDVCGMIGRDLLGKYLQVLSQVECVGQIRQALSSIPCCLVCEFLKQREQEELMILAESLASQDPDHIGSDDALFCRPHFLAVLNSLSEGVRKSRLLQTQFRAAAHLAERLAMIIEQHALRPFAEENRIPHHAFYGLFGRPYLSDKQASFSNDIKEGAT